MRRTKNLSKRVATAVLAATSPLYKQLLKLLAKEPHGCAGPLRLAQIFAELGVKIAVQ